MISISDFLTIGGWIVAGVLATLGIFNSATQTRRKENDRVTSALIDNLNKTTDQQKDRITELEGRSDAQDVQISELVGRNKQLTDIFQGRDPIQAQVFKEAPAIFAIARENHDLAKANAEAINKLATTMDDFITRIPTHLFDQPVTVV